MSRNLTPYDTGQRLEPKPWSPYDPESDQRDDDRYGRVDYDNDEGATELTVYVEPTGGAPRRHTVHIEPQCEIDELDVTVAEHHALVLTPEMLDGLQVLVNLAREAQDAKIAAGGSAMDDPAFDNWITAMPVIETIEYRKELAEKQAGAAEVDAFFKEERLVEARELHSDARRTRAQDLG